MKSFLKQIEESFYSLEEKKTRPDFLDLDGDGDTEEPMKTAAKENVISKTNNNNNNASIFLTTTDI